MMLSCYRALITFIITVLLVFQFGCSSFPDDREVDKARLTNEINFHIKLNNKGYYDSPTKVIFLDDHFYVLHKKNVDSNTKTIIAVVKVNLLGDVIWQVEYKKSGINSPKDMVQLDDGFAIAGFYIDEKTDSQKAFIFFIDKNGLIHDEKEKIFSLDGANTVIDDLTKIDRFKVGIALSKWQGNRDNSVREPVVYDLVTNKMSYIDSFASVKASESKILGAKDGNLLYMVVHGGDENIRGSKKSIYKIDLNTSKVIWTNTEDDFVESVIKISQINSKSYVLIGHSKKAGGRLAYKIIGDDGATKDTYEDFSLFVVPGNNVVITENDTYSILCKDESSSIEGSPYILTSFKGANEESRMIISQLSDDVNMKGIIRNKKFGYIKVFIKDGKTYFMN